MALYRSKIFLTVTIIILLVFLGIIWLWFQTGQAETFTIAFLDSIVQFTDIDYSGYIHPNFEGDLSLIDFLSTNRDNLQYEVLSSKRISLKEAKVSVNLLYNDNSLPIQFKLMRINNDWLLSYIPKYTHIPSALLLSQSSKAGGRLLTFDIRGVEDTFYFPNSIELDDLTPFSIHIIDENILYLEAFQKIILSKVVQFGQQKLEDIYEGQIEVSDDAAIYLQDEDRLSYLQNGFIPVGASNVIAYINKHNSIQFAIYDNASTYKDIIRVLIGNSTHSEKSHEMLDIQSNDRFRVRQFTKDKTEEIEIDKGSIISFRPVPSGIELFIDGQSKSIAPFRWYIDPLNEGLLSVLGIEREFTRGSNLGTPYKGTFEISKIDERLVLINEIPIEKYLPSVVTSEMPVSFGLEALRVQAICARAYALASLNRPGFAPYGAHLDDSTASQMYNNIIEHPSALNAVEDTVGLVPIYDGEIVDTRFFSTSPGYTAASHEVWSSADNSFPGSEIPYLQAKPQFIGDSPGLHNEDNFRAFIDKINDTSYDRFSPFFRWTVEFTREEIEMSIAENLKNVKAHGSPFILTKVGDVYDTDDSIPEDIGNLLNLEVIRRGHGGNIMELEISTTNGRYRVLKELNVRNILKPIDYTGSSPIKLQCHDDSIRENFPLLPSAFAYIDIKRDNDGDIQTVTITGGGYGHGVGMSQYGVYGLTLSGKTYREIIEHYYPSCQLENMY
ncbi:MAG: SpoIID/LytB domain-containing protein [Clostridiales bacterium]|nr:SpoIID/LytB domain-containing protein [Clostridiales bacterium]